MAGGNIQGFAPGQGGALNLTPSGAPQGLQSQATGGLPQDQQNWWQAMGGNLSGLPQDQQQWWRDNPGQSGAMQTMGVDPNATGRTGINLGGGEGGAGGIGNSGMMHPLQRLLPGVFRRGMGPGDPNDPNTDYYGDPEGIATGHNPFPRPPFPLGGQGYRML